jgi:hypothetical protein
MTKAAVPARPSAVTYLLRNTHWTVAIPPMAPGRRNAESVQRSLSSLIQVL